MRRLFLIAVVTAVAQAKPEMYKEKEDFQYSRSSSDDGSKSGFYGAQRGNMGGNYEKAHNMDSLAQHQMSGLVSQVQGELGDASKTRTGSVFTAANSRGVYGSGSYDLSNLEGRNFQEGLSFGDTQSSLSSLNSGFAGQSSSDLHSTSHSSSRLHNSRSSGYQSLGHTSQTANLQAADNVNRASEYEYAGRTDQSSGYYSQSGYHSHGAYDQSNTDLHNSNGYGSNVQSRLVSATPVRIVIRPGGRVAVPVAAQTYAVTNNAFSHDQNAINSEAEALSTHQSNYRPSTNPKHYESSYSYRKEWEKHNSNPVAVPLAVPTVSPFPKNSELYDDTQVAHNSMSQYHANERDSDLHSSNIYSGYNANVKSASSSQSKYQSGYNTQQHRSSSDFDSSALTQGAYNLNANADLANLAVNQDSKPKSYQSSYSYHKSWERQGDPYVIKPSSNGLYEGQESQKLISGIGSETRNQYGSHYKQAHQSHTYGSAVDCDCDENGHIRVARSYNMDQNEDFDMYQQSQTPYEGQEELGQQAQSGWENLEDLGQQTQSKWDNLEELGQQTQNQWDTPEDTVQETQSKWENFEQSQSKQDDLVNKGEETQQTVNIFNGNEKIQAEQLEDLGQQTQNKWDSINESGQQIQNNWYIPESQKQQVNQSTNTFNKQLKEESPDYHNFKQYSQTSQKDKDGTQVPHQIQNTWDKLDSFGTSQNRQYSSTYNTEQSFDKNAQTGSQKEINDHDSLHKFHNTWDKIEGFGSSQNTQNNNKNIHSSDEQLQLSYDKLHSQIPEKEADDKHSYQQTQSTWNKINSFGSSQNTQNINENINNSDITKNKTVNEEKQNNLNQVYQTENVDHQSQNSRNKLEIFNQNKVNQGSTVNDKFKPAYGQSDVEIQQTVDNTELQNNKKPDNAFFSNTGYVQHGVNTSSNSQGHKDENINQETQTNHGDTYNSGGLRDLHKQYSQPEQVMNENNNYNLPINSYGSTQNAWDKINNFDQDSSISSYNNHKYDTSANGNGFSHTYTSSQIQNMYQNWVQSQTQHSTSSFDSAQNSYNHNQFRSHYSGYRPWQSTVFTEDASTTEKSKNDPKPSQTRDNDVRPLDIGRGDIGADDVSSSVTTTVEKSQGTLNGVNNPHIFTSNIKPYKTPEEIETLSLTKDTEYGNTGNTVTPINNESNQHYHLSNANQNTYHQSDSTLSVVSLNQQKWLEEHRLHEDKNSDNQGFNKLTTTSSTTASTVNINSHTVNEQGETQQYESFNSESQTNNFNHVKPNKNPSDKPSMSVSDSQLNIQSHKLNKNHYNEQENLDQAPVEIEQQQNMEQQFEDFDQNNENLNQQSQSVWGENLEDLGQQVQTAWIPNENLQQSNTQQIEDFGSGIKEQNQQQDFYDQKYYSNIKLEDNKKKENAQSHIQNTEILTPSEPVTESTGFWKSVGNKFTNAKDKVTSWFSRS